MANAVSVSIGDVVDGRFRVDAKIGVGGMGEVFRAHQLNVNRPVALKLLKRERMGNEASLEQFLIEATAISRLTSPHTITLHDFGRLEDGSPFIAMELLVGHTLRARLAQSRLSTKEAFRILDGIALSLSEAHARDIVHRDLKPSNVMLVDTPGHRAHVKVLDFGLARLDATESEETVRVAGTPFYMAPEALRDGVASPQTDVYALGMLAFELFSGAHPFGGLERSEIVQAQMTQVPPPLNEQGSELPVGAVHLIARALAKSPRLRPADAGSFRALLREAFGEDDSIDEMRGAVQPALDTITVGATEAPAILKPSAPPKRSWRAPALVGLIVVGVAGATRILAGDAPAPGFMASPSSNLSSTVLKGEIAPITQVEAPRPTATASAVSNPSANPAPETPRRRVAPTSAPSTAASHATVAPRTAEDPCRPSPNCFLFGRCTTVGGTCTATSTADCRLAEICDTSAQCTLSGGACAVTSSADCKRSVECRIMGACKFSGGRCVE